MGGERKGNCRELLLLIGTKVVHFTIVLLLGVCQTNRMKRDEKFVQVDYRTLTLAHRVTVALDAC
jgi:hypothetical protein